MEGNSILRFINGINNVWSASKDVEANKRAAILSTILSNSIPCYEEWNNELKCDPPQIDFHHVTPPSQFDGKELETELYNSFVEAFQDMPWKHPRQLSNSLNAILKGEDNFKSAMLIGTRELGAIIESEQIFLGLTYLSSGTTYPQHAHDATELYYTLLGSAGWGPSLRHLTTVHPGNFILHSTAQPHAFYVSILYTLYQF